MNWRTKFLIVVVLLAAVSLPYLLAAAWAGPDHQFAGFLLNPADGNSYLAKMQQGYRGMWQFHLPFTAQPGEGAPIFLFYLAAGHLARALALPSPVVYNLLRLLGAVALTMAVIDFCEGAFPGRPRLAVMACWLAMFCAGMGWLVVFFGVLPSDMWVAEMYPFLSAFTNPHFPLGIALLLWGLGGVLASLPECPRQPAWVSFSGKKDGSLVASERFLRSNSPAGMLAVIKSWEPDRIPVISLPRALNLSLLVLDGLLLSIVLPFGVVVLGSIVGGMVLWQWAETRRFEWQAPAALMVPGGLYLVYQYWSITSHPVLAGWNSQNLTPAPALWDFVLSLSPALPLAVSAGVMLARRMRVGILPNLYLKACLVWLIAGAVLVYLPFPLQRRFLLGYYLPLAVLAVWGVDWLSARLAGNRGWLPRATFALSLPTIAVILLLALFGTFSQAPELYLSRNEAAVLDWLRRETPPDALVLASPEMGLFIPAFSGQRVIYGHPFETIDAAGTEEGVKAFYRGDYTPAEVDRYLREQGIDYIIMSERERLVGQGPNLERFPLAYQHEGTLIYLVGIIP